MQIAQYIPVYKRMLDGNTSVNVLERSTRKCDTDAGRFSLAATLRMVEGMGGLCLQPQMKTSTVHLSVNKMVYSFHLGGR